MKMVLQKIIALSGQASRREAEKMIKAGRVKINGRQACLGDRAEEGIDIITINGKPLPKKQEFIYLKLNKPIGYTCTNRVFAGEKNIFSLIPLRERLFSIGRLDKNSQGLIILTNDGALAHQLSHPRFQQEKIYEVKVSTADGQELTPKKIQEIQKFLLAGADIGEGDGLAKVKKIKYLQNNRFVITLSEGKKRQIRRLLALKKLTVVDLKRINFAGIDLGSLNLGAWQYLSNEELKKLKAIK